MSTPTVSVLNTNLADQSSTDKLIGLLGFLGHEAKLIPQETGFGFVLHIGSDTLSKFDGSAVNQAAADKTIRDLMYPFQEMMRLLAEGNITGFGIFPTSDIANEVWANQRTEFIGRTLQSLSSGEISLR